MPADRHESLLNHIAAAEVTRICQELVRFRTVNPPGAERAAAEYVAALLEDSGFEITYLPLDDARTSVLARLRGSGELPALVLDGHLDVVPIGAQEWTYEPFEGRVADGKVWGRGAADMKGGLAAMLVAARTLASARPHLRGDLVLSATVDEESGMTGARSIVASDQLGPVQAIIISEPSYNRIGLAERGVLWLELTTYGKTAHGSTPEMGDNAVMMMVALLAELERLDVPYPPHPILGHFTRSVGTIAGGVKTNVIPDRCVATVDMRTVPGQDHDALLGQVRALIDGLEQRITRFRAGVRVFSDLPAVTTAADEPVVRHFAAMAARVLGRQPETEKVRFATEASIFVPALAVPVIIFGPGDPALAHQPDEFIEIDRMVEAARIYTLSALELLS